MKLQLFILAVLALRTALTAEKTAPLLAENSPSRVAGEYVVVFEETISDDNVSSHLITVQNMMSYYGNKTNKLLREFHIGKFRGYGALMDDKLRDSVRLMNNVQYVECSQYYYATQDRCSLQTGATWGIVRTTFRNIPTEEDYSYAPNDGEGVDVYIIDTGIFTGHPDFGGRAFWGVDYVDDPSPKTDLNGHGTHCAGTVMSDTWGLARKATAIAVRVLNENGSGTTNGVISGVNYVANQHTSGKKSIANMSLGGGFSSALNSAVNAAVVKGVSFAVAAGNEAQNACNVSPASAEECVAVGASDESDQFASFSNWGTCVDIIGPGVGITSTWLNRETNTISGTSMAAPHVAGVMAKYLSSASLSPADLKTLINNSATQGKIKGLVSSTPDRLIFKDCM